MERSGQARAKITAGSGVQWTAMAWLASRSSSLSLDFSSVQRRAIEWCVPLLFPSAFSSSALSLFLSWSLLGQLFLIESGQPNESGQKRLGSLAGQYGSSVY